MALFPGMDRLAQLRAVGGVARALPSALVRRGCTARLDLAAENAHQPVVLVHGYAGTDAVWAPLRTALADTGFGYVVSLNYGCITSEPADICAELNRQAGLALAATGTRRVHLIGHSMGGLIVRRTVAATPLATCMSTAVTIASPHRGAPLASIAPGRCARIMRDRDSLLAASGDTPAVRWLNYHAEHDRFVPRSSARIADSALGATDVVVADCGHLTVCRSTHLIASLIGELTGAEAAGAAAVAVAA